MSHGGHPNQANRGFPAYLVSRYNHLILATQAHHLLRGDPEKNSTVVVTYKHRVLEMTVVVFLVNLNDMYISFTAVISKGHYNYNYIVVDD